MRSTPIAVAIVCALFAAGTASAKHRATTAADPFMPSGTTADAPAGFVDLCTRDLKSCAAGNPVDDADLAATVCPPAAPSASVAGLLPALADDYWVDWRGTLIAAEAVTAVTSCPVASTPPPQSLGTAAFAARPPKRARHDRPSRSSDPLFDQARAINLAVNRQVIQVSDLEATGQEERWQRPDPARRPIGDCEDIAIEKRMRLIEGGFPADRLFFAIAYHPDFGLHTVLVARLRDGDEVLDSLTMAMRRWQDVHYVWLRAQEPGHPLIWHRVGAAEPSRLAADALGSDQVAT